ncbi:hypothetical protein FFLO_04739 [Filobasidium floriforme]|uniref:dolichol kinase n=1 Tax=Filobasidium floriforme TaxID=5210 RepID=A0A8K0JJK3_9TREE|nr:hypothetical protein FFLO_04739 [Filobasidium floriforme]
MLPNTATAFVKTSPITSAFPSMITPASTNITSSSSIPSRSKPALLPCRVSLASLSFPWIRKRIYTPGIDQGKGKGKALDFGVRLTRRRCERALLLASAGWVVDRLGRELGEVQVAFELGVIIVLTMAYLEFRTIDTSSPGPGPETRRRGSGEGGVSGAAVGGNNNNNGGNIKARSGVTLQHGPSLTNREKRNSMSGGPVSGAIGSGLAGSIGTVWATEPKDYRDCLDDGAAWALLLGPILSGSMFYETCTRLREMYTTSPSKIPAGAATNGWQIEAPLVSPSTRPFIVAGQGPSSAEQAESQAVLAISALAYSRKQACHLMCLLSLLLLGHTLWSRRRQLLLVASSHEAQGSGRSDGSLPPWSKRSEWRRTGAVVAFSFVLTAGFVVLKVVAQVAGVVGGYDYTYSDLVISTLFFQFCLYVCVRLARRGFTLGELGIICHAGTGLFMEVVNLTRTKISIFNTPFVRTYRLPTPLLIFQLALIPGSFLCGFLLSPLLVLSRRIAQRPVYRLRYPEEKQLYRKGLAAGFYAGAILICGGLIGFWARWCLCGRNPVVWVVMWLMEGQNWYSRPVLIGYWAALAGISVGGWTRQLSRARRHRGWTEAKVTNGQHKVTVVSKTSATKSAEAATARSASMSDISRRPTLPRTPSPTIDVKTAGLSGVASHMMDEMDQRLPVFSVNARRKFFHALAVVMFVPGIIVDPAFTHLSFSLAFAIFNFAEYVRYFALYPFGAAVHLFLNEFLDKKDSGTAILSHFYLLTGCAGGIWLDSPRTILSLVGVFSLGVGDALVTSVLATQASIVGKRIGRIRWSTSSGKTVEGSLAFLGSLVLAGTSLSMTGIIDPFSVTRYTMLALALSLMEAVSEQNDNLILPIWGWCLGTCLGL